MYYISILLFFDWENISEVQRSFILKEKNSYYERETSLLLNSFIDECDNLGRLYKHNYEITESEQKTVYDWVQNQLREIVISGIANYKFESYKKIDMKLINSNINTNMKRKKAFGWKCSENSYTVIKFPSITRDIYYQVDDNNIELEKTIAWAAETFGMAKLNEYIRKKCSKIDISYDENSIKRALSEVQSNKYVQRSFSYILSCAPRKYETNDDYKKLRDIEKQIEFVKMEGINEPIFIKKGDFSYKFEVTKVKIFNPTEQQYLQKLEELGKYKNYYYVDDVRLDKETAIERIKKKYYIFNFDLELSIGFQSNDVLWFRNSRWYK